MKSSFWRTGLWWRDCGEALNSGHRSSWLPVDLHGGGDTSGMHYGGRDISAVCDHTHINSFQRTSTLYIKSYTLPSYFTLLQLSCPCRICNHLACTAVYNGLSPCWGHGPPPVVLLVYQLQPPHQMQEDTHPVRSRTDQNVYCG